MKTEYKKLIYLAYGQSLALERLKACVYLFDSFLNKKATPENLTQENIRWFADRIKKESNAINKDNNRILEIVEDLKG